MNTYFTNPKYRKSAFSLVELFVLAAVIAVLASLFFISALGHARQQASESGCLNNLRRMTLGWQLYASDNRGNLPINAAEGYQPNSPTSPADPQWCPGRMDPGATAGQPTNVAWIKIGQIYPYVGSPAYYRCPADVSTYRNNTAYPTGGQGNPRARSYSMNAWISPDSSDAIGVLGSSTANYRVYHQENDLTVPGADNLFLLVDENPYSINDAFFWEQPTGNANPPSATEWTDVPAVRHAGAAGISFCDGHVQMRKWTDPNLLVARSGGISASLPRTDLLWLLQRTTAHK
jgi:prepilin-type processing-associated H-X9-DG protein